MILAATVMLASCVGGHPDGVSGEIADSIAILGHNDGLKVKELKEGSMERERLIMEIKARGENMKNAGYPVLAQSYIDNARIAAEDSCKIFQ